MQALVLSGGGSKGAFTAGVVYHMLADLDMNFDLAVGTSTGSLIGGPALLEEPTYLRNVYTGVDNSDIWHNSFLGTLLSLICDSHIPLQASMQPLHRLLTEYYIERGKINALQDSGKTLIVTTVNGHTGEKCYLSSDDVGVQGGIRPETFVNGVLASASVPVFCRPVRVFEAEPGHPMHHDLFWDGGVREFVPLDRAARKGAETVYAVLTQAVKPRCTAWAGYLAPESVDLVEVLKWVVDTALNEVAVGDMFRAHAYHRAGYARQAVRAIAAESNLEPKVVARLVGAIDDLFPEIDDHLRRLYVISPAAELQGESLEFNPRTMHRYFTLGRKEARSFFEREGSARLSSPGSAPEGWIS